MTYDAGSSGASNRPLATRNFRKERQTRNDLGLYPSRSLRCVSDVRSGDQMTDHTLS